MSLVTIKFPDASGSRVGTVNMRWVRRKTLQTYLKEQPLKAEGLLARSKRCYIYRENNQKVRLQYVPESGETLTFVYAPRALS